MVSGDNLDTRHRFDTVCVCGNSVCLFACVNLYARKSYVVCGVSCVVCDVMLVVCVYVCGVMCECRARDCVLYVYSDKHILFRKHLL